MAINFRKTAPGIPPHGVKETMIMDEAVNLENATTNMLTYVRPQFPGVRLKGIRREKIENAIMDQMIREETELNTVPPSSLIHFCSTTQRDFRAGGFKPQPIPTVHYHDYTSENAVTFWSENYKQAQGVTAVSNPKAPFKRSAYFSTPLSERVDDEGPPLFNCDEWDNFDFSISNYNYKKNRDGRF
ncbi:sperm-associated antigen 8 isoform X2 [Cynoglossus semilaevis]|nr:sperm-associated antigen 8-like isoform X2 [Cynoglossus semilaevis]